MGIRLPTSLPVLTGAVYRLYTLAVGAGTSGYTELLTFGRNNTLSFGTTTATFIGTSRGYTRPSDRGAVTSFSESNNLTFTLDGPGVNGAINLSRTEAGEVINLKGFVSEDGKVILLRLHSINTGLGERLTGIIMAVRQ